MNINENKIVKNILWGISAIIGIVVADNVYKIGAKAIENNPKLIGDVEVISDEIDEES